MVKEIVNEYVDRLEAKAQLNGGFPDTQAMRIALFGQVAFQYEQRCQSNYKSVSDQIIYETQKKVHDHINNVKAGKV